MGGPNEQKRKTLSERLTEPKAILSVGLVALMLIIGLLISDKLYARTLDRKEIYNKAIKIDNNQEMFQYGIDTNVGNALVYGELVAVDPVSYGDIDGEYLYLKKVREEYQQHEITTKDSEGNTKTEYYYSWDVVDTESIQSQNVIFCGININSNKIRIPAGDYIATVNKGINVRYAYYGYPTISKGTLIAYLNKDTIVGDSKALFYNGLTTDEAYESAIKDHATLVFWLTWIVVIIVVMWVFYHFDSNNR